MEDHWRSEVCGTNIRVRRTGGAFRACTKSRPKLSRARSAAASARENERSHPRRCTSTCRGGAWTGPSGARRTSCCSRTCPSSTTAHGLASSRLPCPALARSQVGPPARSPAGVPISSAPACFRFRADVRRFSDRRLLKAAPAGRSKSAGVFSTRSRRGAEAPPAGSRRGGPGRPVPAAGRPAGRGSGLPSPPRWAFSLAGAQAIDNCQRGNQ